MANVTIPPAGMRATTAPMSGAVMQWHRGHSRMKQLLQRRQRSRQDPACCTRRPLVYRSSRPRQLRRATSSLTLSTSQCSTGRLEAVVLPAFPERTLDSGLHFNPTPSATHPWWWQWPRYSQPTPSRNPYRYHPGSLDPQHLQWSPWTSAGCCHRRTSFSIAGPAEDPLPSPPCWTQTICHHHPPPPPEGSTARSARRTWQPGDRAAPSAAH